MNGVQGINSKLINVVAPDVSCTARITQQRAARGAFLFSYQSYSFIVLDLIAGESIKNNK